MGPQENALTVLVVLTVLNSAWMLLFTDNVVLGFTGGVDLTAVVEPARYLHTKSMIQGVHVALLLPSCICCGVMASGSIVAISHLCRSVGGILLLKAFHILFWALPSIRALGGSTRALWWWLVVSAVLGLLHLGAFWTYGLRRIPRRPSQIALTKGGALPPVAHQALSWLAMVQAACGLCMCCCTRNVLSLWGSTASGLAADWASFVLHGWGVACLESALLCFSVLADGDRNAVGRTCRVSALHQAAVAAGCPYCMSVAGYAGDGVFGYAANAVVGIILGLMLWRGADAAIPLPTRI